MKSKTKTILIFAAILAAVFLTALLDGGAVQSAAEEEEEGTLIGAFVSEEDLDIDDLEITATGKIQWKRGRLYAEKWEKSWRFPNLPDGGGFYSALRTETEGEFAGSTTPQHVSFGEIKTTNMAYHVYDDNGIRTTDIDLSGEVYACGDRQVIFKLYPIYQTSDGRIYLTRGNSMGMSGADGASITHTLTSDKTETIGGKSERVKVRVAITVAARPTPTKFTVAHMDENDDLLKLEEFAPDASPSPPRPARRISSARAMARTGTARRRNTTFAAAAMTVRRIPTQIWTLSAIRAVSSAQSASRSTGGRKQHETTDRLCTGTRGGVRCEFCALQA